MRSYDFSPLFRSTVGFDHLARMLDSAQRIDDQSLSYPPYNIEKLGDDNYRITMAVAGFAEDDLEITAQGRSLLVAGKAKKDEAAGIFLHRGIAGRSFERRFELADTVKVTGANLQNGLLHIELVREVPEALKPRTISITKAEPSQPTKLIDTQAA